MSGDLNGMGLPTAPRSNDIAVVRESVRQIIDFLKNLHLSGLQVTQFSDAQIASMTGGNLAQVGKIFYDLENNTFKGAVIESGAVAIKTFTVT